MIESTGSPPRALMSKNAPMVTSNRTTTSCTSLRRIIRTRSAPFADLVVVLCSSRRSASAHPEPGRRHSPVEEEVLVTLGQGRAGQAVDVRLGPDGPVDVPTPDVVL